MAAVTLRGIRGDGLPGPGLELEVADREFVLLVGRDPSELSVVVRMIAGLDSPAAGEILVDGGRIENVPAKDRPVAFVGRGFVPYPNLSVHENISLGLQLRKFGKSETEKRVREVVGLLGIEDCLGVAPGDLSLEQRQFVALARAMARQPKVYLFDEPFAELSAEAQRRGRRGIAELRERSTATIIYATSNTADALALGGRTVMFEDGAIQQDADARILCDEPANLQVARFFCDPPMNLIHGTLKGDRDGVIFAESGEGTISLRLPGSLFSGTIGSEPLPVVLGIRPEHVRLVERDRKDGRQGSTFRALIERLEINSSGTDIYLQTGAHSLVGRTFSRQDLTGGGRRAEFSLDLEKVRLFDGGSGYGIIAGT